MGIKQKLKIALEKKLISNQIRKERAHEEYLTIKDIAPDKREKLTEGEKREVAKKWSRAEGGGKTDISFAELEVFKHFNGFDPRYLGHNLYLPLIARRLNNYHYTKSFEDKGLFGCCPSEIAAPKCIVRCIDGEYYSNRLEQISRKEAEELCLAFGGDLIVKPSRESSGGNKVVKCKAADRVKPGWFEQIVRGYGNDWVAQECITQHGDLAVFNPGSVNTFRITSLYLNGKATICSSVFRWECRFRYRQCVCGRKNDRCAGRRETPGVCR